MRTDATRGQRFVATVIPTTEDCIYAAGLFDGEGTVRVSRHRIRDGRIVKAAQVVVAIANTYAPIIAWLQERWGGQIHLNGELRQGWKPGLKVAMSSRVAARFLADIAPYVRIKREGVENALAFQRLRHGGRITTPELREAEAVFADRSRLLNQRGIPGWPVLPPIPIQDLAAARERNRILRLTCWLERRGGRARVRDMVQGNVAGVRSRAEAEAFLADCEKAGIVSVESSRLANGAATILVSLLSAPEAVSADGFAARHGR